MNQSFFVKGFTVTFIITNIIISTIGHFYPSVINLFALSKYSLSTVYFFASVSLQHAIINTIAIIVLYEYYKDNETYFLFVFWIGNIAVGLLHYYYFPAKLIVGASGGILALYGFMLAYELYFDFKQSLPVHLAIIGIMCYVSYMITKYSEITISHEAHIIGLCFGFILYWVVTLFSVVFLKVKK